jgi:lysylphosphatidylglycerol synthetase-like protein (DUF2156 family)
VPTAKGGEAVWTTYAETAPAVRVQIHHFCADWADDKRLPEMRFTFGGFPELVDPEVRLMLAIGADGRAPRATLSSR